MPVSTIVSTHPQPTMRASLRLAPPPLDPPYDDERPGGQQATGWSIDGSLALSLPLRFPAPRETAAPRPALRLVKGLPPRDPRTGRDITPADLLPPPGPRAGQLVRAVLEVLSGDRPARHLSRVTALDALEDIDDAVRHARNRPWARTVRSLHLAQPAPGVAEVTAVVDRGDRCAAMAMRLEGLDGRWIITEIALG